VQDYNTVRQPSMI